jgi:hypothetical protein
MERRPNSAVRRLSGLTLGLLASDSRKREKAGDYYREALAFIDQASDFERKQKNVSHCRWEWYASP